MEVRQIPDLRGATGRSVHGPYWLWESTNKHPKRARPEGEVKINFDYYGYLASPVPVILAVQDDDAAIFLERFEGGELLVASNHFERAFLFQNLSAPIPRPKKRFEIGVQLYEYLRPIPDAFEWPLPEAPPPTEEELEAEAARELERQRRILMTDPGSAAIRYNRGRLVRKRGSTKRRPV